MNVSVFLRSSLLVLGSVVFLNSCSSSSSDEDAPPPEAPEEKTAPALYIVQIEQMKFLPADISVHIGDTIMWMNNDMVAHDVTEEKSNAWTSSLLQPGKSWRLVVTTGADYYCSIHKVMKGSFEIK